MFYIHITGANAQQSKSTLAKMLVIPVGPMDKAFAYGAKDCGFE